jgi:PmbA protein
MGELMHDQNELASRHNQLEKLSQEVLALARAAGADSAEVEIALSKGFSVTAHDGSVETVAYHQDKVVDITVYFGKRMGSASLSDLSPEAIQSGVAAACHIARFTDHDPMSGLAQKSELAFGYTMPDLSYPWAISVEEAIQLAIQCEEIGMQADPRILCAEGVDVSTGQGLALYANSEGFVGWFPRTHHEMSCIFVAKSGEERQRDYDYTVAVDPTKLVSAEALARHAASRTVSHLGARRLPTQKAPVVFAAEEARGLFGHFISAIAGSNIYRHASFLCDHLGKVIFPTWMHIQEQPDLPQGLGSAPFDDDGVRTRRNVFVDQGVLNSYALGVYSARHLKMQTTGNAGGVHNLMIKYGSHDFAALLKEMGRGLLVTETMGNGVNILTGDYSRGISGFWIENGEIQFPVQEVTIASTLPEMFRRIVTVGNDIDHRGNIHTGSVLIEEMTIAGE